MVQDLFRRKIQTANVEFKNDDLYESYNLYNTMLNLSEMIFYTEAIFYHFLASFLKNN